MKVKGGSGLGRAGLNDGGGRVEVEKGEKRIRMKQSLGRVGGGKGAGGG